MIPEPLASVGILAANFALQEDAPRPVEHDDPLAEERLESVDSVARVGQTNRLPPREIGSRGAAGSLGV
jgi:hypothetical protein